MYICYSNAPKKANLRNPFKVNYASGHFPPPDSSRLAPSPSSQPGTRTEGTGKGKGKVASTRSAPSIKPPAVNKRKAAQSSLPVEAEAGPRGDDDDDSSDHSDHPLAQNLATKPTPAPKSRKKAAPKRTAAKAKADAKTSGATAAASANSNSRKRGAEERRGNEETVLPVALPRVCEDLPDVAPLPPAKRAQVLQEKKAPAPRKRKEHAKDGDDGVAVNEPPEKKRRRADPPVRYVMSSQRPWQYYAAYHLFHIIPRRPSFSPFHLPIFLVTYSFFIAAVVVGPGRRMQMGRSRVSLHLRHPRKRWIRYGTTLFPPFSMILILLSFHSRCYHPRERLEKQPRKANLHRALLIVGLDPAGFPLTCCAA